MQKTGIFLLLTICLSLSLDAQIFQSDMFQNHIMRRDLRIHTDTCVIDMQIIDEDIKIKTKPHLTYHWYKNRKIFTNQGGIGGQVLDGKYLCYSHDDKLIEDGWFYRGLKHGTWKRWDDKGDLLYQKNYYKGLLQGKSVFYFDGLPGKIINYKKGKAVDSVQDSKEKIVAEKSKELVEEIIIEEVPVEQEEEEQVIEIEN